MPAPGTFERTIDSNHMLTRQHAIARYDSGRIYPDMLTRQKHAHYLNYAERMLLLYQRGAGRTRQELHRDVQCIFGSELDCPVRRVEAFCKLLDDVSEFDTDSGRQAAALRRDVFQRAALLHPLVREPDRLFEHAEAAAKAKIAQELGRTWADIEHSLFADVMEFHRLREFRGYPDPAALLGRYNVAQTQAALYDAVSVTIHATQDFKTILRYAKLARLMHTIRRTGDGQYQICLDGPASVLRQTRRYGSSVAKFLPALLACRGWRMHAIVQTPRRGWNVSLDLSPKDQLKSHLPSPAEFDSHLEQDFAHKWGNEPRDGWTLTRETEILQAGQRVFVPDFVFQHSSGRQVLFEIIGFWTPEYLEAKAKTLQLFAKHPIVLAINELIADQIPGLPANSIRFKTALKLQDVLAVLKGFV